MKKLFSCFLAMSLSLITGCGQMGPLYLPGHKSPVYVPKPKKVVINDAAVQPDNPTTAVEPSDTDDSGI